MALEREMVLPTIWLLIRIVIDIMWLLRFPFSSQYTIIPYKDEEGEKDEDENDNDIHILECHVSHPLAFS